MHRVNEFNALTSRESKLEPQIKVSSEGLDELVLAKARPIFETKPDLFSKDQISKFVCQNLKTQYIFNSKTTQGTTASLNHENCKYIEEKHSQEKFGIIIHQLPEDNAKGGKFVLNKGQDSLKLVSRYPDPFLFVEMQGMEAYKTAEQGRYANLKEINKVADWKKF